MKYFILLFLLYLSVSALDGEWTNNYKSALKTAKKEHKNIYMLVTSSSCRWCRKFERDTLQQKAVLEELQQDYILVHVDRAKDFLPKFVEAKRVPKHYFITQNGEEIYSFLGYWDELDFRSFLLDVKNEYKEKIKKGILE